MNRPIPPMVQILANRFHPNSLEQIAKECDHICAEFADELAPVEARIFFNAARNLRAILNFQTPK